VLPCAEGRASRAEALLRKVDERKAAAEVERRKAADAAGRLEQQVRGLWQAVSLQQCSWAMPAQHDSMAAGGSWLLLSRLGWSMCRQS